MRVTLKSILLAMASLVVLIFLSACTGKRADAPKFPYPKAPLAISQPVQKAQYLVEHYWDNYISAAESGQIEGSQIDSAEWAGVFKNYFALLSGLYSEGREELCNREIRRAVGSADSLYLKGSKSLMLKIVHYSELFLYDPNSPLLNEELYIPVVEELLASQSLEEESKGTFRFQMEQLLVNRKGAKAADIKYKYCVGETHGTLGRALSMA